MPGTRLLRIEGSESEMTFPVTGVILAGGRSTRFAGKNKALLRVGGRRIIDRIYRVFRPIFEEIIVVANDPRPYLAWDVKIVTDLFDIRSSLTGIHAGLFHAAHSHAFFSACDTPFLQPALVGALVERIRPGLDVIIPETAAGMEPLCAVYARRALPAIEKKLESGRVKIQFFFNRVQVETVPESDVRRVDPGCISFINVNTAEELATAEAMIADPAFPSVR